MSAHLLLVEDDDALHRGIEFTLRQEGFQVTGARTIAEAEAAFAVSQSGAAAADGADAVSAAEVGAEPTDDAGRPFDLIVLDVQLPDGSGFDFCARLRRTSDTPIVFLTASDAEIDVVRGLDLGGDDYITKPFRLREFLSRIQAVLRRRSPAPRPAAAAPVLQAGDLTLHAAEMRLTKQGRDIPLSVTEFRLLSLLMGHPRAVLSKEQIAQHLWQDGGEFLDDNTVAVNVRRLREKIEDAPNDPRKITTVRGAGYRWNG